MHLDSLCAYLVFFFVFIIILVLLCHLLLFFFVFVIFQSFRETSKSFRAPFFLSLSLCLLQLFKYLSSASVHLTISVCLAICCSPALFINSITNFRFRSAANFARFDYLCFSYSQLPAAARADLNLFYLLIARTIFH